MFAEKYTYNYYTLIDSDKSFFHSICYFFLINFLNFNNFQKYDIIEIWKWMEERVALL